MARTAPPIELSSDEDTELRAIVSAGVSPTALRARIVLAAATGATNKAIAEQLGASAPTVGLWRERFAREGVSGLLDAPRSGRPADDRSVRAVLEKATEPPPDGNGHWTVRGLARATGLPPSTVHRIWRGRRRHPELADVKGLDLAVAARLCQLVGLFVDPPAAVLAVDVAAPARGPATDRGPLVPVDGDGPGAFDAFLRRCRHAAVGELLLVTTDTGHVTTEAQEWVDRHGDVTLQRVTPAAWPAVADTWMAACSSRREGDPVTDLTAAAWQATDAAPAAWSVEPGPQVDPPGGR